MHNHPIESESVLVVEDDVSLREMYRSALRAAGFSVIAVPDGEAALRHLEGWRPSAVVLDLALPYVGGRDVHRELRARSDTRDIPIVVVTGTDMSDVDAAEFSSLLMKPIDPDLLVFTVETSIRKARGRAADT